ncbi:hypothetical protein L6252_00530 [Candidatus Parcubacteria bacterium]|nr:hypothetical protein [Candidatus Parcubacteria bacterium]
MKPKIKEKEEVIKLRKKGFSYGEIKKRVPVSSASLSLWLSNVELSKEQQQRLKNKWRKGQAKGAKVRHDKRVFNTKIIKNKAFKEIGDVTKRDLLLLGVALYWAEGSKEKEINKRVRGCNVKLCNSDPFLINVFLKYLFDVCNIARGDIKFRIYLHETARSNLLKVQKYWSKMTNFPIECFSKVSWKKNKIKTKRKNIGNDYYGLISVVVAKSTNLNRKISGHVEAIIKNCRVV